MSLKLTIAPSEPHFSQHAKSTTSVESPTSISAVPTRASTPEIERNSTYDSYNSISDKDFPSEYVPTSFKRYNSTASSTNSIDSHNKAFLIDVQPKRKKFANSEERRLFVEDYKRKYKTELCKTFELKGTCRFGDKCCFAHGRHELKAKILTHVKYKTKPCKQYHQTGYCPYGQRCQYLHKEAIMPNVFCVPEEGRFKLNPQLYDTLHEVNRLCGTDCELNAVLDKLPKRSRLSVFGKYIEEDIEA